MKIDATPMASNAVFCIRIPPFLHTDDVIAGGAHEATDVEDLGRPGALNCIFEGASAWGRGKTSVSHVWTYSAFHF